MVTACGIGDDLIAGAGEACRGQIDMVDITGRLGCRLGTGHHSMIKYDGQWYAVYHARDYDNTNGASAFDARNARICKLHVNDGIITAERYKDKI